MAGQGVLHCWVTYGLYLGFIQEIGPYYLEDGVDYKRGQNLTLNPHSWHNVANLLFL